MKSFAFPLFTIARMIEGLAISEHVQAKTSDLDIHNHTKVVE
jgi:hypothetical protein